MGVGQHWQNLRRTVNSAHSRRACGIVQGCLRRSRPSRPPSWVIGATRSSPAARRWSSTRSATSTECSRCSSERGARLSHVVETHIHNDYVSGGPELCRVTGATLVIPAGSRSDTRAGRSPTASGSSWADATLVARHTPGHTATHMAYLLEEEGRPVAAFTGGSMLLGSVGRTDLVRSVGHRSPQPSAAPVCAAPVRRASR